MTQTFARVVDGLVVEVATLPDGVKIVDCYQEAIAATFVACSTDVKQGYSYSGKKFSPPAAPEISTAGLIAYAAAKRFSVETGGISVNGSPVSTNRESQALITGAYNFVQANPSETVHFKTSDGFVELTAAQMTAIANAVGAHVQASFATEASVSAAIADGSITTTSEIDAAPWPANN